jgi:hypothetical protein
MDAKGALMTMGKSRPIVQTGALFILLFQPGCKELNEMNDIETRSAFLTNYGATIDVSVSVQSWNGSPQQLCFSDTSRCYSLSTGLNTSCTTSGTTINCRITWDTSGHSAEENDQPFVDHPDNWDRMYLRNESASNALTVRGLVIELKSGTYSFKFVNESNISIVLAALGKWDLDDLIRQNRESKMLAYATGFTSFDSLPWMVREAAYDIGQMGILKYRPWDTSGQNGCDEFYNYVASHYSNNIHYGCVSSTYEYCTYFRWYGDSFNSLAKEQFYWANRLNKMIFNALLGTFTIQRCTNEACTTTDASTNYAPRAGDLIWIQKANGDIHAMMSLGIMPTYANPNVNLTVIDKNELVVPQTRVLSTAVWTGIFVGEVDNELGGGRPYFTNQNAGYRAIQQLIF